MRDCKQIESLIFGYISGDIMNSERKVLDQHLDECDTCLNEVMRLQSLDLNLMELTEDGMDLPVEFQGADLTAAIISKIPPRMYRPRPRFYKVLSPSVVLSTLTLCLAVLVFILAGKVDKINVAAPDSGVKSVKILFSSNSAQKVSLVGDFNAWGAEPLLLKSLKDGMWEAELQLKPGMYEYNLVVDGQRWISNPNSDSVVPDGFGGTNSVVIVNDNGVKKVTHVEKGERI